MKKNIRNFSHHFELPIVSELINYSLIRERKQLISYTLAKKNMMIPIHLHEDKYVVAVSDPTNLKAIQEISLNLNFPIETVLATSEEIQNAIEYCYQKQKSETHSSTEDLVSVKSSQDPDCYDLLEVTSKSPVVEALNMIFLDAIQLGASDIHFEPKEGRLEVRCRIDGILQPQSSPPIELQQQIMTRIKVLSKLDIAEKRLPQDGRLKLRLGTREIDFRVSTLPVVYGERIVLRILDKGKIQLGLKNIGFAQKSLKYVKNWMELTEGIILVTGPTGSGKTTTLYSILSELNAETKNILTIEDPVEYKLPKISQIGVNPKIHLNFAKGLRHILRQDPDIIMVGEIRDYETAEIAIQASLTGHLVLSTIHTNDAPATITRLVDMGIEPYLIASSLVGVIAQRLVRTVCTKCKKTYKSSSEIQKKYQVSHYVKGKGCTACYQTGYKGRIGIFELMNIDSQLQTLISNKSHTHEIRNYFLKEKMPTLWESGMELVKKGKTSLEEVIRVTRSNEEII